MPTVPETATELPEIELIERDGFELAEAQGDEPVARGPVIGSKTIALASIAVIVVALAVIARPGAGPNIENVPTQTTRDTAPTTSIPDEATGAVSSLDPAATQFTQPIPLFDDNVPVEIPGVISAIDSKGSLIVIDRRQLRPSENRLGLLLVDEDAKAGLSLGGGRPIDVDRELSISGTRVFVTYTNRFVEPSFDLTQVSPDGATSALLIDHHNDVQDVTLVPLDGDGGEEAELVSWTLPGSLEILGAWRGNLVVHRANRIWMLDPASESTFIADGQVLSFDGVRLARLHCDEPDACRILVGPPDRPDARAVELPETLRAIDHEAWTGSVAISPDGRRLGASVRHGALSLPLVIDLESGEAMSLADGMNREAPVAWSPDGRWLAYVNTDDVMVWNIEEGRSWRIGVNRKMQSLHWR